MFITILAVISVTLGIAAGSLIPTVSDVLHTVLIDSLYCSCLIPFELVQTVHCSAYMSLQQSEMLGMLLRML